MYLAARCMRLLGDKRRMGSTGSELHCLVMGLHSYMPRRAFYGHLPDPWVSGLRKTWVRRKQDLLFAERRGVGNED